MTGPQPSPPGWCPCGSTRFGVCNDEHPECRWREVTFGNRKVADMDRRQRAEAGQWAAMILRAKRDGAGWPHASMVAKATALAEAIGMVDPAPPAPLDGFDGWHWLRTPDGPEPWPWDAKTRGYGDEVRGYLPTGRHPTLRWLGACPEPERAAWALEDAHRSGVLAAVEFIAGMREAAGRNATPAQEGAATALVLVCREIEAGLRLMADLPRQEAPMAWAGLASAVLQVEAAARDACLTTQENGGVWADAMIRAAPIAALLAPLTAAMRASVITGKGEGA